MRPYITDTLRDGKHVLPYQIEGVARSKLLNCLLGRSIKYYEIPTKQSLKACWQFRITLDSGDWIEFSSACTEVGDWQEVGSLNIRYAKFDEVLPFDGYKKEEYPFKIQIVDELVYKSEKVNSECGIIFGGEQGALIVAAGVAPGSVSIKINTHSEEFEPEFDEDDYIRQTFSTIQ